MKSAQLLLLCSAAFLAACNACSQKKPETTDKPASPPPAATNNDVIPSKATVTTVFFSTEEKTLFWMETTNGTHAAPPDTSFWTSNSVIVPENDGWHVYETDGNNYGIAVAPTEGITPVAEVLKKETTAPDGYAWEPETSANGFQKVFINPAMGKRQRIGVFPKPPTDPVWMEGERPAARGAETPMLSSARRLASRPAKTARPTRTRHRWAAPPLPRPLRLTKTRPPGSPTSASCVRPRSPSTSPR